MKRVFINRAKENDLERFKQIAFNSKLRKIREKYKIDFLKQNNYLDMRMFGEIEENNIGYLKIEPKEDKAEQLGIGV